MITPRLELGERSRDELAHGPEPRRELLLREREVHCEPCGHRASRLTGGRGDVMREPLVHRPEGETTRHVGEAAHAPRHGLQQRHGNRRVPPEKGDHFRPRNEERPRRHRRNSRGDVSSMVE